MTAGVPYGRWPSPISARDVARASVTYDAVQMIEGAVYWIEGRPQEGGRDALVRWTAEDGARDVLPRPWSVGSRVHEYGGGAYLATRDGLWFCDATSQRLHRLTNRSPEPITPEPPSPASYRYADARLTADGRLLVCVRERHEPGDVVNELVALPADGSQPPQVIASGWDFYATPRPSPDGRMLAWTSWRHPLMPWDGTWLWIAEIGSDGNLSQPTHVAGGPNESVLQPEWNPDGTLHFVSDRSGWWNLYRQREAKIEPVLQIDAELGVAPWEFDYSTYTFLDSQHIAVLMQQGTRQQLAILDLSSSALRRIALPYTSIKPYLAGDGDQVVLIGASPTKSPAVAIVNVRTENVQQLASTTLPIDDSLIARPEPFTYATKDGQQAHGLFYPPTNPRMTPPSDERPPLIVRPHPGPTSNATMRLDPRLQFFTSRGFAVADIDYRGSTGYGRAYRQALNGNWGKLDVSDCTDAVDYLAANRRIDPNRVVISGASAGGYTALRALATTNHFIAGIATSAIIDLQMWRDTAPKFQKHQGDNLNSKDSTQPEELHERTSQGSGLTDIHRPLLLTHGVRDKVAPIRQIHGTAQHFDEYTTLKTYPDEGHIINQPKNIESAIEDELEFITRYTTLCSGIE